MIHLHDGSGLTYCDLPTEKLHEVHLTYYLIDCSCLDCYAEWENEKYSRAEAFQDWVNMESESKEGADEVPICGDKYGCSLT